MGLSRDNYARPLDQTLRHYRATDAGEGSRLMKKLLLLVVFLTGCSASIGTYERGLWFDDDVRGDRESGFGLKLDLVCGEMVRPFGDWGEPDFVLKCPMCGPFFSVALGELGFYIGLKSFKNSVGRYDWLPTDATAENPDILFCPSATIRRTRRK